MSVLGGLRGAAVNGGGGAASLQRVWRPPSVLRRAHKLRERASMSTLLRGGSPFGSTLGGASAPRATTATTAAPLSSNSTFSDKGEGELELRDDDEATTTPTNGVD